MKITALEVDGYGVWSDLRLEGLSDGLNVMFGPNEAGKTTLMHFMRSVLYGFSPQRRRYLPPQGGGLAGGSVHLSGPNGRFKVSRHENPDQPRGPDLLEVTGANGTRQGEHLLKALLCDVDEHVFNNVFTVGLPDLQHLGTLDDSEAAASLYNLSAGMDRLPLVEVIEDLDDSRNHILHRNGQPSEITKLIARRDELRRQIQDVDGSTRSFASLATQRDTLSQETATLEESNKRLKHQLRVLEIAVAVRERWQELAKLDDRLEALGPIEAVPESTIRRLSELDQRIDQRRRHGDELKRHWEEFRAEAQQLQIDPAFWRLAARVEVLHEQEEWIDSIDTRNHELRREIGQLEGQLSLGQKEHGLDQASKKGGQPRISPRLLARMRPLARELRQCRQNLADSEARAAAATDLSRSRSDRVMAALGSRGEQDLARAIDAAASLVEQLRRQRQVDKRLGKMKSFQAELEGQTHDLLDGQMLPLRAVAGLGAMCVLGAALFGAACLFEWVPLPYTLLGMAIGIATVPIRKLYERYAARRLSTCQRQTRMLQSQIDQATQEAEALDEQLPLGRGTIADRLKAAERDLVALEELVPLDSEQETSRLDQQQAVKLVARAERELAAASGAWRQALTKAGLPPDISPRQIRDLVSRDAEAADIRRRLELRREELEQRNRELKAFRTRVARLANSVGIKTAENDSNRQIKLLAEYVAVQESRHNRREVLRAEYRKLRRKRVKHNEAMKKLKLRRRDLLRSVGAEDESEFKHRADAHARAQSLRHDRENLEREIEAAVGGYCSPDVLAAELDSDSAENLPKRRDELRKSLKEGDRKLRELIEKRGRLGEQIDSLADNRSLADKRLELSIAEKQLEDAVHRWRVRAVTCEMLEGIKETYEKDRQPEALREASGYLRKLTRGRYSRVWTPLGDDALLIDDPGGKAIGVGELSRGTREQLFVSLRLALVSSFARRGAQLPIVLDDVFVNFDTSRAKATAAVIRDFAAAGHQLFVFTCHEHIVKLFKSLRVQITQLPDSSVHLDQPAVVLKPPRAKPKAKPKPKKKPKKTPKKLVALVEPEVRETLIEALPEDRQPVIRTVQQEKPPVIETVWMEPPVEQPEMTAFDLPWDERVKPQEWSEVPLDEVEREELGQHDHGGPYESEYEDEYQRINGQLLFDSDQPGADLPDEVEDEFEKASRSRRGSDDWDDKYEDEYDEEEYDEDQVEDEFDHQECEEDEAEDEYMNRDEAA